MKTALPGRTLGCKTSPLSRGGLKKQACTIAWWGGGVLADLSTKFSSSLDYNMVCISCLCMHATTVCQRRHGDEAMRPVHHLVRSRDTEAPDDRGRIDQETQVRRSETKIVRGQGEMMRGSWRWREWRDIMQQMRDERQETRDES